MKTLGELARALRQGTVTSRALTEQALERIEDPGGEGPRAFVRVFRQEALAAADASDRLRAAGLVPSPLAGIPVSVKDLCDVAGVATLAGSATRRQLPPAADDAAVVARLRAAGAVIVGTTNMTEFALGGLGLNPHFGDCRNPWDRDTGRVPGGSSSGAAVSVADGMAAAGLGTDTMGSVRIPAGFCGLVGFKPTAARIPLDGLVPLSTSMDSVGPLARSVACCALMDAVFAGERPAAPEAEPLAGLRLGVPTTLVLDDLDPKVAADFDRALAALSSAGARIERFAFAQIDEIARMNRTCSFSMVEGYALHRHWLREHGDGCDPRVRVRFEAGSRVAMADYFDALRLRADLVAAGARATQRFDAILMPTLPVVAPPVSQFTQDEASRLHGFAISIRNTSIANYLDRCALTVPCHEPGSAPVGLSLVGHRMDDARLLRIGCSVEAALAA